MDEEQKRRKKLNDFILEAFDFIPGDQYLEVE
jgi:hypothetical protein